MTMSTTTTVSQSSHLVHGLEVILGTLFFSVLFYLSVHFLKRYKTRPIWNGRTLTDTDCYDISIKIVTSSFSVMNYIAGFIAVGWLKDMDIMEDQFWFVSSWVYFSVGYYIYDIVMKPYCYGIESKLTGFVEIVIGFAKNQPLMLLHHVLILTLYYPTMMWWRKGKGDFVVSCFFLMDLAVPFIQVRHVMYRLGMASMPIYLWNGIVLVVMFFLSRIYILYYIYWKFATYHKVPIVQSMSLLPRACNLGMLSLLIMQGYWFGMMVKKLAKYLISHGKAE